MDLNLKEADRRTFRALNIYLRKKGRYKINNLTCHFKKWKEQMIPEVEERK